MGLFDLFKRTQAATDHTQDWSADKSVVCEFAIDQAKLGGVGLSDSFDQLRWLGPCEDYSVTDYYYFSKGLQISESDGTVDHFILEIVGGKESLQDHRYHPFAGECTFAGQQIELSSKTSPEQLIAWIGEPRDREHHDGNLSLHYTFNDAELSFDFISRDGDHILIAALIT